MKLVIFKRDWCDEFWCEEFTIYTEGAWSDYLILIDTVTFPIELYFGTNQGFEFDSKEDFLSSHTVKDITYDEAAFLVKHLGKQFGAGGVVIDEYDVEPDDDEEQMV
jgi:hypothetical protein